MNTIAQLIDAIAAEIEPATMARDPDSPHFRTAAEQQACEHARELARGRARRILVMIWDYERERAERSGSAFRAAHARCVLVDLENANG